MGYDLRHAIRAVGRAKGTTGVILLSLGLGTGANAAVYSVLDRLLMRHPPGIDSPSELVSLYTSEYSGLPYGLSSYPDLVSARQSGSLSALAMIREGLVENARVGKIERSVRIAEVSEEYFSALGMDAQSGQLRTSEWRRRGDRSHQPVVGGTGRGVRCRGQAADDRSAKLYRRRYRRGAFSRPSDRPGLRRVDTDGHAVGWPRHSTIHRHRQAHRRDRDRTGAARSRPHFQRSGNDVSSDQSGKPS